MKLFAFLVLFLVTCTTAAPGELKKKNFRLNAYCSKVTDKDTPQPNNEKTKEACRAEDVKAKHDKENHLIFCELNSGDQVEAFREACLLEGGLETCFHRKGNELPKGKQLPQCTDSEICPLKGNENCGCIVSGGKPSDYICSPAKVKFPGKAFFRKHPKDDRITAMGRRLQDEGCGKSYKKGPGPQWTEADRLAYQCWQRDGMGYTGAAADGYPGPDSWDKLNVVI